MKLRELQKEFTRKGVKYTQIIKSINDVLSDNGKIKKEGYLLYKCRNIEFGYEYYELFRHRIAKPHPHDAQDWDMVEVYPGDEQFGMWAFCCSTKKSVVKMLKSEFGIDYDIKNLFNLRLYIDILPTFIIFAVDY